jgi:type II secretory pathway predicted ATPase ExeA
VQHTNLPRVIGGLLSSQWLNLKSQSLLEHFGLSREPFNITPDPGFLYLSPSHQQALARIVYGIDARKGFIVLTGEVGTGKTTLVHTLIKELEKRENQSTLIFNTISQSREMLRDVCEDLGFTAFQENRHNIHTYLRLLNQLLLESYRNGKNVTLIIDEAQTLSPRVLESIRLMSNFETPEDKLLQIVMAGQPELAVRLNLPSLRQLKQRVVLYYHLKPLNHAECAEYIGKRLEVAGGSPAIFTSEALQMIHNCSGGVPRLINILCDNGMLAAYTLGEKRVRSEIIRQVAEDRSLTTAAEEAARARGAFPRRRVEAPPAASDEAEERAASAQEETKEISADEHLPVDATPDRLTALIERLQRQKHLRISPEPPTDALADGMNGEAHDAPEPLEEVAPANGSHRSNGHTEAAVAAEPRVASAADFPEAARSEDLGGEKIFRQLAIDDPDVLPIDFLEAMIGTLTEAMGPMASMVVWDQVAALGERFDAFPKARLAELIEAASGEILEEPLRIRFQQIMSAGIKD